MATMTARSMQLLLYFCLTAYIPYTSASSANESSTLNVNSSEFLQGSLPDVASLCPYNQFCLSSPLKGNLRLDQKPCCERCSCEHDCHETRSCCPDMPGAGLGKPKYPCIRLSDLSKHVETAYGVDSNIWYHVITNCSDEEKALEYPKCYKPTEVHDFMIVSDPNGRVYRNKHCAECNAVQNYVHWKLQVDCRETIQLMYLQSIENRDRYLLKNCNLLSIPPEGHTADMSYCLPNRSLISKCNSTGKWDVYDKRIEEACMKNQDDQNAYFIKELDFTDIVEVYKSVYCYLCNVPKSEKKVDTCKIKDDSTGKTGRLTFLAILDTKILEEDTGIQDQRCGLTTIWDPYTELCRRLECPIGTAPLHGSCRPLFSTIEGYTVAMFFEVIFSTGSMTPNNYLLQVLERRIFLELGNDLTCEKCRSALFIENSSIPFFRLVVFSTAKCPTDILFKRIRKLAFKKKMYLKYRYKGQPIRIELILILKGIEDKQLEYLAGSSSMLCGINKRIDSSIFLYCPMVMLTKNETYYLGFHNLSESSLTVSAQKNATELEFQQVCVDTYFLAHEARSRAVSPNLPCMERAKNICFRDLIILVGNIYIRLYITLHV